MHKVKYRAIFISDVHLGTRDAQMEYLFDFLRCTESEYLFLVGDIIDLWKFRSKWHWPHINNNIVQIIFHKARQGAKVIYIPGNHDERLRDYAGMLLNGVTIVNDYIHETAAGKRLLVIHGDEFDSLVLTKAWLVRIGEWSYDVCLWLNRQFNRCRRRLGFPYWSLSHHIKTKVKNAIRHIERFEEASTQEARRRGAEGVVCGHIHFPKINSIDGVHYCNTGDWVENCTAIVENADGSLDIIRWLEEKDRLLAGEDAGVMEKSGPSIRRKAA